MHYVIKSSKKRGMAFFAACVLVIAEVTASFLIFRPKVKTVPAARPQEELNKNYKPGLNPAEKINGQEQPPASAHYKPGLKTAFLTFDDGPSALTPELISTLEKNDVRATFFVVGLNAEKYPDTLDQMIKGGNVIGVHSWTHRYSYIYKNTDNFLADFNELDDYIYSHTGVRSDICRFPGGTNNTVCRHYGQRDIMRRITTLVHEKGFEYFDWNVSSGEASSIPPSKETILNNVLSQCKEKNTAVILFHDTNNQSYIDVLPEIISGLRSEGFSFDTLSAKRLSGKALKAVQFIPA